MTRDKNRELTRRQAENARAAIRVGVVLRRLHDHMEGNAEMSPTQVKAAQILLDKSLPTLQAIENTQIEDKPELNPEDVERLLRDAIEELARHDPDGLKAMIEEAKSRPMLKRVI